MQQDGMLLLDKPARLTSQQCLSRIKKAHQLRIKIGHTGTLDPFATGLLPVCLGQATKISQLFLEKPKSYHAQLSLGKQTDTGDNTGVVIRTAPVAPYSRAQLEAICEQMQGKQMQTPPPYSAKKYQGTPLYAHARKGVHIERQAQVIHIYDLAILQASKHTIHFSVRCSKGTYVRTLGETIAEALGTCGHLCALRRMQVGALDIKQTITLDDACAHPLVPYTLYHSFTHWLPNWHGVLCSPQQEQALRHGKSITPTMPLPQTEQIYIYNQQQIVIAVAVYQDTQLLPKRLLVSAD